MPVFLEKGNGEFGGLGSGDEETGDGYQLIVGYGVGFGVTATGSAYWDPDSVDPGDEARVLMNVSTGEFLAERNPDWKPVVEA